MQIIENQFNQSLEMSGATPAPINLITYSMDHKLLEESQELALQFEKRGGLLPVIVQEKGTMEILMLGYANQAAFEETLQLGYATFWSTSRQELWTKGLTSGDMLKVLEIRTDCDQDALIYLVERMGEGACHTKGTDGKARKSCFYRRLEGRRWVLE